MAAWFSVYLPSCVLQGFSRVHSDLSPYLISSNFSLNFAHFLLLQSHHPHCFRCLLSYVDNWFFNVFQTLTFLNFIWVSPCPSTAIFNHCVHLSRCIVLSLYFALSNFILKLCTVSAHTTSLSSPFPTSTTLCGKLFFFISLL